VIVECKISYKGKPAKHYAVLVAVDDEILHFADPFPHPDTRKGNLRAVRWEEFQSGRWAIGVGPGVRAKRECGIGRNEPSKRMSRGPSPKVDS